MIATDLPQIILCSVLGVVVLLIAAAIILFTVRARVTIEIKETFSLWVSFLGIKKKLIPEKPKKYKLRDYTPKKIAKRDAKAAKKREAAEKREAARQKRRALKNKMTWSERRAYRAERRAGRPRIPDILDLFLTVSQTLFSTFFGRLHFHVVRIRIKVGSTDAAKTALLCSAISIALEPIIGFIHYNTNLHDVRKADVDISPDYLSEEIKYDVKLAFSMSLASLIWVILRTGIPGIIGWTNIQPPAANKSENKAAPSSAARANTAEGSKAAADDISTDTKSNKQ